MANLWQLFILPITNSTKTLVGGSIDFYEPGTTGESNRKDVYVDSEETEVAANPYTLGTNATAEVYGTGLYHVIIKDADGVTVYDFDYILAGTGLEVDQEYSKSFDSLYDLLQVPSDERASAFIGSFYTGGTTGGGDVYWDSTKNKNTANGGSIIDPDTIGGFDGLVGTRDAYLAAQGTGVGTGCYIRKPGVDISLDWWGLFLDETTDDSPAITKCIQSLRDDAVVTVTGTPGVCAVANEIHMDRPVFFDFVREGQIYTTSSTDGKPGFTFLWTGASGGTMFTQSVQTSTLMDAGTTTGEVLFGGGMRGVCLNGGNTAAIGVRVSSTMEAIWDVQVRQFTQVGLVVDGGNGILSLRNDFWVHMIYGATSATYDMVGIHFRRFNSFPSTQNTIHKAWGIVYDGSMVLFQDTDNNNLKWVHAYSPSDGYAIRFIPGVTANARDNVVGYCDGDVYAGAGTFGNVIDIINSEGSSVEIAAGAQLHYRALDYVNAELWTTNSYLMSDVAEISGTAMRPDGAVATSGLSALIWGGISFPDSATGTASCCIPGRVRWGNGDIVGVTLLFATEGTNSSDTANFIVRMSSIQDGYTATATPEYVETFVVDTYDVQYKESHEYLEFTTPVSFTKGDAVYIRISRQPLEATDTVTGAIVLKGILVHYEGDGPAQLGPFGQSPMYYS